MSTAAMLTAKCSNMVRSSCCQKETGLIPLSPVSGTEDVNVAKLIKGLATHRGCPKQIALNLVDSTYIFLMSAIEGHQTEKFPTAKIKCNIEEHILLGRYSWDVVRDNTDSEVSGQRMLNISDIFSQLKNCPFTHPVLKRTILKAYYH